MFPDLEAVVHQTGQFGPVVLFAIAIFLFSEFLLSTWRTRHNTDAIINKRMRVQSRARDQEQALIELRRRRGLAADGRFQLPFISLNRLIMQSGIAIPASRFLLLMIVLGTVAATAAFAVTKSLLVAPLSALAVGFALPVAILMILRTKRLKAFEGQLPEAIDIIVRSLKAGHPLPAAVAMVAREMPDPIGSEFGVAADEMTYGMDLETAMANLRTRAGHSDLGFLVVAISIQLKTGGNLAEILTNLSSMIRARARMRRKVQSLSAEGRFSALALSIIPCVLAVIVSWQAPGYFEDVKHDPMFVPSIYVGVAMWLTGIFVMYRMVNFKV